MSLLQAYPGACVYVTTILVEGILILVYICVYNKLNKFEIFSSLFDRYLIGLDFGILIDHTAHSCGQDAKTPTNLVSQS